MVNIPTHFYDTLAEIAEDKLAGGMYWSGTITCMVEDDIECEFIGTFYLHRHPEDSEIICDAIPIWWEFHTYELEEGRELPNDFTIKALRARIENNYLI